VRMSKMVSIIGALGTNRNEIGFLKGQNGCALWYAGNSSLVF
jgi:hypothetical protein